MFIVALPTIAEIWKQLKCPSTDEWIKKMWEVYIYIHIYIYIYIHTHTHTHTCVCVYMDYYSANCTNTNGHGGHYAK